MIVQAEPASARRIDRQARRLVDHQRLRVEEKDAIGVHRGPSASRVARWLAAVAGLAVAWPAQAQLCDSTTTPVAADGRAFGHLPYGDAPPEELVEAPPGTALRECMLRRDVMPDLIRLVQASGGRVLALSCHRSIVRQAEVFCREGGSPAERAISVAPPGHSEHASGFALDFAFRPRENECPDVEACVADTAAFRWLVANGPRYGFEMSFPAGNRQNVKWEPWHWRWVGSRASQPGAGRARSLFRTARLRFAAVPGVDTAVQVAAVRPIVYLSEVPGVKCRRGKCRPVKARRRART